MTTVRLTCRFSLVEGDRVLGAWISSEIAGSTHETSTHGRQVIVTIPEDKPAVGQNEAIGGWIGNRDAPKALALKWFDTTVDEVVPEDPPTWEDLKDAFAALVAAASQLVERLRVSQPWIGLVGVRPDPLRISAIRLDTQEPVFVDYLRRTPGLTVVGADPLTAEEAAAALSGEGIAVADLLLAQARYLAHFSPDVQPHLAVLLAAMACEAKMKTALIDGCSGDPRTLIAFFLDRPRGAAHDLFGEVAELVLGRSLKSNRPLFNRVKALFRARNGVAHGARMLSPEDAIDHVRTALDAFAWINEEARFT